MTERPFGTMDPNSQHQRWSRWVFGIEANPTKCPDHLVVVDNARRYFRKAFKTVGRVRCDRQGTYYCLIVEIEGPPAHDPGFVDALKRDFAERFLAAGFGASARLTRFEVALLAGDAEDGRPPDQMLVMPRAILATSLGGQPPAQTLGMPNIPSTAELYGT